MSIYCMGPAANLLTQSSTLQTKLREWDSNKQWNFRGGDIRPLADTITSELLQSLMDHQLLSGAALRSTGCNMGLRWLKFGWIQWMVTSKQGNSFTCGLHGDHKVRLWEVSLLWFLTSTRHFPLSSASFPKWAGSRLGDTLDITVHLCVEHAALFHVGVHVCFYIFSGCVKRRAGRTQRLEKLLFLKLLWFIDTFSVFSFELKTQSGWSKHTDWLFDSWALSLFWQREHLRCISYLCVKNGRRTVVYQRIRCQFVFHRHLFIKNVIRQF